VNSPAHRPKQHRPASDDKRHDQGIERNPRGEEQPTDKGRAQQISNVDEAARQPPSPGQPAGGE
jgi:hypothetical protein